MSTLREILEQTERSTQEGDLRWSPQYSSDGNLFSEVTVSGAVIRFFHGKSKIEVTYGRAETAEFGISRLFAEAIVLGTEVEKFG